MNSKRSPSQIPVMIGIVLALTVVLTHFYFPLESRPGAAQKEEENLLFHASFDRNFVADQAAGDENPLGNQNLKIVREGKKDSAVYLDSGSLLTYDAPGNLYAERGTIGFWWKLDEPMGNTPFSIIQVSYAEQSNWDFTFAELRWTGNDLRLSFRDRDAVPYEIMAAAKSELVSGRWFYLAFTWDELDGIHLYIDGHEAGRRLGELHLAANLDQVGIHTSQVTPHQTSGTERKVLIDELRFYNMALTETAIQNLTQLGGGRAGAAPSTAAANPDLWNAHWKARFGWQEPNNIPQINSPTWIRKVSVLEGKDLRKFSIKASDGKRESCWPSMGPGYLEEGKALDLTVENEPFNYALLQGNFKGQVFQFRDGQKILWLDRSNSSGEATYFQLPTLLTAPHLRVERQVGVLGEVSLFSIRTLRSNPMEKNNPVVAADGPGVPPPDKLSYRLLPSSEALNLQGISRGQIASLYNLSPKLVGRFLPADREAWVGVPAEIYKPSEKPSRGTERLQYCHVVVPPFLSNTGLDAIKLKLNPEGRKYPEQTLVHVSASDPVDPHRDLIDLSLRLPAAGPVEILLDVRDLVVPAGAPLWLVLASDQKDFGPRYLNGAEVEMWMTETGRPERAEHARKEYFSDRLRWIRELFQRLSHSRPWMSGDVSKIRRQFKLVDEIYRLIEDVLRVDPKEPTATAYSGWIKRNQPPPDFKQPEPATTDIPRWAFQQGVLVRQFKEVVDWWIKNRQIETGEMGGGLRGDAGLIANWPGIALMEGPSDRWRDSVRAVVEACYHRGLISQGLNAHPADALQAYEEGLNTVPLAFLLDYGNPLWIERLMETARQYERLTGINSAGHRHFRSYVFSATDLVEDGRYAKEDVYSQLLWHSGLYLSWYNGNPQSIRWLSEYADALLAHWQNDRYPSLTRGIRFRSDEVISKALPNPEVINLLWGVYRLTGNDKYLWLTDQLLKGGNVAQAEMTNGRWLELVDPEPYRSPVLDEVRKRNIWDHNLQSDETGLLARQYDYELTGDKKQVEDYQAALIKHMAQNMLLYTSAEQATDSIWIPQRATQRARLGGVAHYRNCIYPGNAISWESTGGNIAALVRKATPAALKIVAFNSAKALQDVSLRVWELENGTYEVMEGTDVNGDDEIDVVTTSRTLLLKRHAAIPLALRPRRTTIIDIKQLRKGTPLWELADLAIGPEDLHYDAVLDKGKIIIHNIGGKKSPPFALVVENERRNVLFKRELEGLEAPTDLKPKTLTVELSGLRARGSKSLIFKLEPINKVEEITDENNQLRRNL